MTTLAGSGSQGSNDATGAAATFYGPQGVKITPDGATAIVADQKNHKIRKIDIATGAVTTLAASFYYPHSVALTPDGTMALVPDKSNKIRAIDMATGVVTDFAGSGSAGSNDAVGTAATFNNAYGVAITPDGATAVVCDYGNHKMRTINMATRAASFLAGSGSQGSDDGTGAAASFTWLLHVAITPDGTTAIVTDWPTGLRAIVIATGVVTTIASSTTPQGVSITPDGLTALMASATHLIQAIDIATGVVSTLAGNGAVGSDDGTGAAARFNGPYGIGIAPDGTMALVADKDNNKIRMITFNSL